MARPLKEGLDYFPHDTDALNDEKIEALRVLYGNDGYAFYFILLERIYRTPNFEINISDAETIQILARKIAVTEERFSQILATALKWGCFDQKNYNERGVLTSNGIKKRASIVTKKREEMREKYHKIKDGVSDTGTSQETQPETPQSKEKESKEKNDLKRSAPDGAGVSAPVEIPQSGGAQVNKPGNGEEYTTDFESFWQHYPRRKEKTAAFRVWKARLKEGHTAKEMIMAARNYALECKQKRVPVEYIKHAKTFLGPAKPFLEYLKGPPPDRPPDPEREALARKLYLT